MQTVLLGLVRHMRWADALVADALDRAPDPDAGIARLFGHVAAVEHLWYSRVQGQPAQHAVWPELGVAAARQLAAQQADLLERLVARADVDALARIVRYRNSAGDTFDNSVSEIVTHIAMHGSHHRGQIAQRLRASGREPPYVDYIEYVRRERQGQPIG